MPVHNSILLREAQGGVNFLNNCCASKSVVQRLQLSQTIKCHYGCVNTVNWNQNGSLLVSGSDDTNLCIYDYQKGCQLVKKIETGHTANIFSAKFLPFQDDRIACCAGDDEVRTFHNFTLDQVYTCHQGRVKKIATHSHSIHSFLSASEDGTVRHFDTRIRGSEQGDHIVVAVGSQYGNYNLEVYSLAYDPLCPHYFVVGGGDPYVRLYDMRMLKVGGKVGEREREREREGKRGIEDHRCVKAFCPKNMKGKKESFSMNGHITGVAYSWDGREVVASYSGEAVYLFNIKESGDARTKSMKELPTDDEDAEMESEDDESDENNNNNNIKPKKKNKGKQKGKKEKPEEENTTDQTFVQKYVGHCNVRTVKEINFYGPRSEYVVSGSDCGRIFIWDKKTGDIVNMMVGDRDVVNCASGHPFDPVLATSGIERNVKLWLPNAENPRIISKEDEEVMHRNSNNTTSRNTNLFALIRALTRRQVALQPGEEETGDDEEEAEEIFFPFVRTARARQGEGENENSENDNEDNDDEDNENDDDDDDDEGGERGGGVRCQTQ